MLKKILLCISIYVASLSLQGCVNLGGSSKMDYSPKPITVSEVDYWPDEQTGLSVQAYNIWDLFCPISCGRSKVAVDIGYKLGEMRNRGIQPNVVLLQEAFRKGAENINREAKYPYIVYGPDTAPKTDSYPISEKFHRERSWKKGEKAGKNLLNSGLAILSDYPIISVKRIAFPRGMCAGYDCLASKGILIAWIQVPEIDDPIAFVVIHLNSRKPSGVSGDRADEAHYHQVKMLQREIQKEIDPSTTVIIGGDFSVGHAPKRLDAVQKLLEGFGYENVIRKAYQTDIVPDSSIKHIIDIIEDNNNAILLRQTHGKSLIPNNAWVPFPKYTPNPYSDHAGFIVELSLAEYKYKNKNNDIVQILSP